MERGSCVSCLRPPLQITVSAPRMNVQGADFQRCESVFTRPTCELVPVFGVHDRPASLRVVLLLCILLRSCIEHSSTVSLFQAQEVWK